jgi:putative ABC transport system permease protein
MALPTKIFRALLFAYPAEFRHEYGPEMEEVFRERLQSESAAQVWLDALRDLIVAAPREHLHILKSDLQYATRIFAKSPAFTLMAVLTMAIGVGANTAIFSLVNAVLLRSLPVNDPSTLAYIWTPNDRLKAPVPRELTPAGDDFYQLKQLNHSFTNMIAFAQGRLRISANDEAPEYAGGAHVTGDFFQVLGGFPELGRLIESSDQENVVVISHALWQQKFALSPGILGKTMHFGNEQKTIIGVMPSSFTFPSRGEVPLGPDIKRTDVWVPVAQSLKQMASTNLDGVIGRLAPHVSFAQAQAEMVSLMIPIDKKHTDIQGWTAWVVPFTESVVGQVRPLMWMLFGAVSLVLLIACGNVANLLMACAAGRVHELGVRSALGAERARLIRQMITEALLLASIGGAMGIGLAFGGIKLLLKLNPGDIPRLNDISIDGRVLLFSVVVSLATGFLFGLLPALSASRIDVVTLLKQGGSKGAAGTSNRLRHALIVAEVALSVILLTGAGLLIRSYTKLMIEGPGFTSSAVTMRLYTGDTRPEKRVQYHAYLRDLIGKTSVLAGVLSAGIVSDLPLSNSDSVTFVNVDGYANEPDQTINKYSASPGYFQAMQIPLLECRLFDDRDSWDAPKAAIVNLSFCKRYLGGRDPIGQIIRLGGAPFKTPTFIVGVVGDVKHFALDEKHHAEVYQPLWQSLDQSAVLAVRAAGPPGPIATGMRQAVLSLVPTATIFDVHTMDELISEANARRRFQTSLLSIFAAIALLLALVGIYGLMTYSVKQRTPELGIRMTLGASRVEVLGMVLRQGIGMTAIGVAAGIAGALALTRVLETSLYGVKATDPITFYGVPALILLVSAAACLIPAWKATRIDPAIALRYE